jgi:hypothetical protein
MVDTSKVFKMQDKTQTEEWLAQESIPFHVCLPSR